MLQRYSIFCSFQINNTEKAILLRIIKIVDTIPFANKANFAINNQWDMRIKEVLKENGYTQQMLADKMNVSLSAVKQMVSAESLTTATLEKIATALNVSMWQLFASPEEVQSKTDSLTLSCPHCGKNINIKVD